MRSRIPEPFEKDTSSSSSTSMSTSSMSRIPASGARSVQAVGSSPSQSRPASAGHGPVVANPFEARSPGPNYRAHVEALTGEVDRLRFELNDERERHTHTERQLQTAVTAAQARATEAEARFTAFRDAARNKAQEWETRMTDMQGALIKEEKRARQAESELESERTARSSLERQLARVEVELDSERNHRKGLGKQLERAQDEMRRQTQRIVELETNSLKASAAAAITASSAFTSSSSSSSDLSRSFRQSRMPPQMSPTKLGGGAGAAEEDEAEFLSYLQNFQRETERLTSEAAAAAGRRR